MSNMGQKRVSFKVAQAIKEAGYPQYGSCDEYYNQEGRVIDKFCDINKLIYPAPTYFDVWLWLWRCKKACIGILFDEGNCAVEIWSNKSFLRDFENKFDPEEAIINAINYLVDNNLIR